MSDFVDVARALAWRNVRSSLVRPVVTLLPMLIPLIFFATFAGGFSAFGAAIDFPGGYTSFQFVFIWLQSNAFQGMFSGFLVARDFESGFAKRLMIAAPSRMGIVGGYLLSALIRAAVGGAILFGVGFIAGLRVNGNLFELFVLIVLGFALGAICALWSAGIALRFRTIQAGPLMQMPIFVLLFLSPVFVPLARLKGWIKATARVNPLTVFMEQGRNLLSGREPKVLLALGLAAGVVTLALAWAYRGLRSAERAG